MKLFISEVGSDRMRERYGQLRSEPVLISALAPVETSSAVFRLRKSGSLSDLQASKIAAAATLQLQLLVRVPVDQALIEEAVRINEKYSIRALDSLQLASAIEARKIVNDTSMQFICSDAALLACASAEHFPTWDPCS